VSDNALFATFPRKRPLLVGFILAAAGGLLTLVGLLVSAVTSAANAREWFSHLDQPPREMARLKWTQARAAGMAGADAWRKASPIHRVS
jgi:hypothetical protein